jgi:ABC-type glutathione transport system ATPase component
LDGPARSERVEELLALLGIDHRKHVIVGDDRNKGISGGERKRLCIAVELLTRPQLLFLDEPTSGSLLFFFVSLQDCMVMVFLPSRTGQRDEL